MNNSKKNIVVLGGGTGTSVVLSGLKENKDLKLNAVVVVSDNGGSTGRLRDEFGFLPVGDLRQCLASLTEGKMQDEIRKILLYRFDKGQGLKGHNLGNLILTALEDLYPSPAKAIEIASKIFMINGSVFPITEDYVNLKITYEDGSTEMGESILDDPKNGGRKIKHIALDKPAKIFEKAQQAIASAGLIILGPGDLYASHLPITLVDGFTQALKKNKKNGGKLIYILNLMTHYSQTHNMTALDHVNEISKHCERMPDYLIVNKQQIPKKIEEVYKENYEFAVTDDLGNVDKTHKIEIIRSDLISEIIEKQKSSDTVPRSLLRHNQKKLTKLIEKIIYS